MIVAVEGVSAAGKTRWVSAHAHEMVVPETAPSLASQCHTRCGDPRSWVAVNSLRWAAALDIERSSGTAICDTDPFKLHYTWCEWQTGRIGEPEWQQAVLAYREAFNRSSLGLADAIVFLNPSVRTLRRQRNGDSTRRRRRFERHLSFRSSLVAWYQAVERLEPGRVVWDATQLPDVPSRTVRSGTVLFDSFIAELRNSDSE